MLTQSVLKSLENLTNEEIYDLYLKENDTQYLDEIVVKNKAQIYSIAKTYNKGSYTAKNHIQEEDLAQEGLIGYRVGLERYNSDSGAKVNTYCFNWARKYMNQYFIRFERIVRFPKAIKDKSKILSEISNHNDVTWKQSTHSVIKQYNAGELGGDLQHLEVIDVESYNSDYNVEMAYLTLIIEPLSDQEKAAIEKAMTSERSIYKEQLKDTNVKGVIRKVIDISNTLKEQCLFTLPLKRNREYVMRAVTYEFWMTGFCGDEGNQYPARRIFEIEKLRLGFREIKLASGDVLLKIEKY